MFIFAIIGAVISAAQTFMQMEAARRQQEYQAKIEKNNAIAKQQQADITRRKTEAAVRAQENEQKKAKRTYTAAAGTNRSLLAAGNVDLTTGSALDLLEGNYNRFADDMGEMEYQQDITEWEGNREAQIQDWEADVMLSNASYLDQTAGSVGQSLLGAGLSGGSSFATSYAMAGGFGSSGSSVVPKGAFNPASLAI